MGKIRNVLSVSNENYISKDNYLELKHFCLQYNEWKKRYAEFDFHESKSIIMPCKSTKNDSTASAAIEKASLKTKMDMVRDTAYKTDPELAVYIFKGVTEGASYITLRCSYGMPCSKETYFKRYRKFFKMLSVLR